LTISGSDPEGSPMLRTIESVFQVVTDSLDLKSGAYAVFDKDHQVYDIYLRVNEASPQIFEGATYKVWSEVWGKNKQGNFVPVAWVSGIKVISKDSNGQYVLGSLELNQRWVDKVSVVSDLQLRNLRITDLDWSVILETADVISFEVEEYKDELPQIPLSQADEPLDVFTLAMTQGWRTKKYVDASPVNDSVACTITLVHGYCAGSNPFPPTYFTNPAVFTGGLKVSLSNDAFTRRLIAFIENQTCTTAVAHSQGGMAITHAYNFYVTPFDRSPSTVRLLQTVGTPFQGTALAGSIASLGEIFGAGCGSNNDLTYSGAKSWLASISKRSRVFFYFTQYGKSGLIHYCNLAANLILSWPNDGTTENGWAPLPGGNSQAGNPTIGECHTDSMDYPPQCQNAARCRLMNSYAF